MKKSKSTFPSTVYPLIIGLIIFSFWSCSSSTVEGPAKNSTTSVLQDDKKEKTPVVVCFGNSLTEAYGVSSEESYPALLQEKIDSLGLNYQVVNAGLSGETTAGGLGRLNWVLKNKVDIFILELGANDGLRGIALEQTEQNLQSIIDTVKAKNDGVKIVLAGMQIPPNLGLQYTLGFKQIFPRLAEKNNVALIPFLLEGVAGIPELNQKDGIHPTVQGQKIVAQNVWTVLHPLLKN